MPNVMAAPEQEPPKMYIQCTSAGDGQTSCKVWFASVERRRCSNEAKTRNPFKFPGVHQTNEGISGASGPKFTILCEHVEEILLFNTIFPIVDTCFSYEDTARQSCEMVPRWRIFGGFLHPVFSASRVQHVSDLHPKFALRAYHVWKYGRHPICDG